MGYNLGLQVSRIIADLLNQNFEILIDYLYRYSIYILCFVIMFIILIILILYMINRIDHFIMIINRDIDTKEIMHITVFYLDQTKKFSNIQSDFENMKFNNIFKNKWRFENHNMHIFDFTNNYSSYRLNILLKTLTSRNLNKINIYIYDPYDRYVDLMYSLFDHKIFRNNYSNAFLSVVSNNKNIRFYLIDDLLKKKNKLLIIDFIQTIDVDYMAVHLFYYYRKNLYKIRTNRIAELNKEIVKFFIESYFF